MILDKRKNKVSSCPTQGRPLCLPPFGYTLPPPPTPKKRSSSVFVWGDVQLARILGCVCSVSEHMCQTEKDFVSVCEDINKNGLCVSV